MSEDNIREVAEVIEDSVDVITMLLERLVHSRLREARDIATLRKEQQAHTKAMRLIEGIERERDEARKENHKIRIELHKAITEAELEREAARAERDSALKERDDALSRLDAFLEADLELREVEAPEDDSPLTSEEEQ